MRHRTESIMGSIATTERLSCEPGAATGPPGPPIAGDCTNSGKIRIAYSDTMNRKYLAFDIETAADIPGPDFNWRPHRPIGITCAAIVASDALQPVVWHGKSA